jgi:hypothetical protein
MSLPNIVFKNDLKVSKKLTKLKAIVLERLKEIDLSQFRLNPELTLFVCNLVWNSGKKIKKEDINRPQMVLDILQPIFGFSPTEILQIKQQITFFINNNHIKVIPVIEKIGGFLFSFLKKRLV